MPSPKAWPAIPEFRLTTPEHGSIFLRRPPGEPDSSSCRADRRSWQQLKLLAILVLRLVNLHEYGWLKYACDLPYIGLEWRLCFQVHHVGKIRPF